MKVAANHFGFLDVIAALSEQKMEIVMGRGILLWVLGIPLPVLLLLYLFHVI